ncbi:hypothetical protein ABIB82_001689 [Bradyrhizobium sp. i1.8.4]
MLPLLSAVGFSSTPVSRDWLGNWRSSALAW